MHLFYENHVYEIVEFRLKWGTTLSLHVLNYLYTSVRFFLHVLRVFLNASLKNSGIVLFKSRCVPARTKNSYTSEHFCLCVLRVFLNAPLKNSVLILFKSRCAPARTKNSYTSEHFCLCVPRVLAGF